MHYYVDFDRTVYDTESFKKAFAKRATIPELFHQLIEVVKEIFNRERKVSIRRIFTRAFGTFASHGRFGFTPDELKGYLYPDAIAFFHTHAKDTTIVTYGVRAFITAKVANALTDVPLNDIVYTHQKKGPVLNRLTKGKEGPFVFVDDAVFQLESVSRVCPGIQGIEIRRDEKDGDGRWPVIRSFEELEYVVEEPSV